MGLAIEARNLTRVFESKGKEPFYALRDVNLEVHYGELFGLLGPNGAGKSTLIKILCTLLLPTSGTARVAGFDVVTEADRVRRSISMVSGGEHSGYGILTVRETLWLFAQFYGIPSKEALRRIDEALEVVGLSDAANTRVNKLSTGMRQRMNFVRGLITDPTVLFLDEPTLGLDVETSRVLRDYLKRWMKERPGRTILLTTHYMAEADELCDRVAIIDGGRILTCDTPANLKRMLRDEVVLRMEISPALPANGRADGGLNLESLRQLPGVLGVVPDAPLNGTQQLTWRLQDDAAIGSVIHALSEAGARIVRLEKSDPTLEDVFIKLVGRRLTDAGR
ncbi:MAG: ABC transporter ATP-binding protein [Limnochordales bacterium]|nr:ABC transporter [Bacillota bacterium]